MIKHTKGPWEVRKGHVWDQLIIRHRNNEPGAISERLATIHARQTWRDEAEANARLIAAAPDMLEALIDARSQLEDYELSLSGESYNSPSINAAIAKATGETP